MVEAGATPEMPMYEPVFRFTFEDAVPLKEAEMTLQLAMIALEALPPQAAAPLAPRYFVDEADRSVVVDATAPAGEDLTRVYTALLIGEFGPDAFRVRRVGEADAPAP